MRNGLLVLITFVKTRDQKPRISIKFTKKLTTINRQQNYASMLIKHMQKFIHCSLVPFKVSVSDRCEVTCSFAVAGAQDAGESVQINKTPIVMEQNGRRA